MLLIPASMPVVLLGLVIATGSQPFIFPSPAPPFFWHLLSDVFDRLELLSAEKSNDLNFFSAAGPASVRGV
jgi:hypothetical protein